MKCLAKSAGPIWANRPASPQSTGWQPQRPAPGLRAAAASICAAPISVRTRERAAAAPHWPWSLMGVTTFFLSRFSAGLRQSMLQEGSAVAAASRVACCEVEFAAAALARRGLLDCGFKYHFLNSARVRSVNGVMPSTYLHRGANVGCVHAKYGFKGVRDSLRCQRPLAGLGHEEPPCVCPSFPSLLPLFRPFHRFSSLGLALDPPRAEG